MDNLLFSSIIGDVIGSVYEFGVTKDYNFVLYDSMMTFTDDTIMTIAIADWLLSDSLRSSKKLINFMQKWGDEYKFPCGGYGSSFAKWLDSYKPSPYNSFGNGSAMRVSPVGWVSNSLEECLDLAKKTAEVSHNHIEGIKGAQATAACIYMAKTGATKERIKDYIQTKFRYNLNRNLDDIRPTYKFDETCQGSVPESIICFLESKSYIDAIRLAVSLGGDADTIATITGGIAYAYYKEIPNDVLTFVRSKIPSDMLSICVKFDKYISKLKNC